MNYCNEIKKLIDNEVYSQIKDLVPKPVLIRKDGNKLSFVYFKALRREDYEKSMSGIPVKIDLLKTEKNYRQLYSLGTEYIFEGDTPTYIAGLDRKKELPGDNITDDLYYSTHLENGVETISHKL